MRNSVIIACAALLFACEGKVALNDATPEPEPGPGMMPVPGDMQDRLPTMEDCRADAVFADDAPAPLMTRYEFDNTVRDLLGVDRQHAWEQWPSESAGGGFENHVASHIVNPLHVRKMMEVAETVAAEAAANGALGQHGPLDDFLLRAFRRPPFDDEVAAFASLHEDATARWGAQRADEMLITAVLQSPQFLYRLELTNEFAPNQLLQNSSYEMASRLSYMLWATMPDEELFAAAARDELTTVEQVEQHARRMLADPRAADMVSHFYRQWLHLDSLRTVVKDASVFEEVTQPLGQDWLASIDAFVRDVHDGGTLRDLMTSPTVYVTPELAALYDVDAPDALEPMQLPQRAGLLTQPALLALLAYPNQSSPVHRGIFVREKLLCQPIPAPPDDAAIEAPDPDPNATTREKFAQHTADAACAGCHALIDPIGFGFEAYDGVGRYRTVEHGLPVDASGALHSSGDPSADGPFDGALQLVERLAESSTLQRCVADQWTAFALGRPASGADLCSTVDIRERFAQSDGSFEELLVAIATSDAMRYRVVQGTRAEREGEP